MTEEKGIRIPTKIDLTGLKKGLSEMKKELAQAEKECAELEKQYHDQISRYRKRIAQGGADGAAAKKEMRQYEHFKGKEIDAAIAKVDRYKEKLAEASAYYDRFAGATDASKQVDLAMADDKFVSGIKSQEQYNSLLAKSKAEMAAMESHAARIAQQTGISAKDILRQNDAYQDAASKARILETRSEEISKNIKKAKKETKGLGDETKRGVRSFGKMQLMMMGIMMATRAISAATQEYMATNSKLEGQLNSLKSLWGQVLGPVIEWVVNLLIKAVSAVNSFVYALTGINFVARANAAALNKQAKATGAAAKAQRQLAGFDEQTKLNDTSGGSGGDPVTLLDASVNNISDKLREQLEDGDWYGAGKTVGESLMTGIESVDWHNVGSKIGETVGNAAAFVLGFALSIDPLVLLDSAARLLSGLMDGLSQAIQNIDWMEVGGDIVDLLIKALIASLILTNPFAMLIALIFTPTGQELTTSAFELIGSICGALVAAIVGMGQRIGEIGSELFNTIVGWFDENIDWGGTPEDIINGLFNGIVEALKSVGDWIFNNIWIPFRDGFKEAFDINSPSKKMEDFGVNIIDGLCAGITGAIDKVKQACEDIWEAIKEKFSNVGTWFKEKFSGAWEKVKEVFSDGGITFEGIKEGISSTFKEIVNKLIDGINKIIKKPFDKINGMLNTIRSISVLGVEPFKGLWSYNPLSVPQIPKLAVGGIVNRPGRGVPAIIGEAGAEAVLPLENNTEWMDILADKISGGTVTIPITLDGKRIATYIVDIQKKKAFAVNGA